jgi:hypothetical protein
VLSLVEQVERHVAMVRTVAMLEQIDRLPGAECHAAVDHRYRQIHLSERGPQVCRHVVRPLVVVLVPARIFRCDGGEDPLEIGAHRAAAAGRRLARATNIEDRNLGWQGVWNADALASARWKWT